MIARGGVLVTLALLGLSHAHAGEQARRRLRYEATSPLSYVIVEGGVADRIVVMTIDSSEALPERDKIAIDYRAADISSKWPGQRRRIVMSPRGRILDVVVPGVRTYGRRQPVGLRQGRGIGISGRSLATGIGFPLLPEKEVRPGDSWEESFSVVKGIGEGVVVIPASATYTYRGDVVLQKRNCAVLAFRLSGRLELPKQGGKIGIECDGQLAFDYENGIDVSMHNRIVETEVSNREGVRPVRRTTTVLKRLSEIPLLPSGSTSVGDRGRVEEDGGQKGGGEAILHFPTSQDDAVAALGEFGTNFPEFRGRLRMALGYAMVACHNRGIPLAAPRPAVSEGSCSVRCHYLYRHTVATA